MTITTLIIINIAFILGITLAFILGRNSTKKKVKKNGKKRAKRTKNAKAKVTHGKDETPSKRAVSDQKKGRKAKEGINAKKTMKVDASAFDAETLKAYQDAMKAENSVLPSYDQANMGHQPELNLDPDAYLKNMQKDPLLHK